MGKVIPMVQEIKIDFDSLYHQGAISYKEAKFAEQLFTFGMGKQFKTVVQIADVTDEELFNVATVFAQMGDNLFECLQHTRHSRNRIGLKQAFDAVDTACGVLVEELQRRENK